MGSIVWNVGFTVASAYLQAALPVHMLCPKGYIPLNGLVPRPHRRRARPTRDWKCYVIFSNEVLLFWR